MSESVHIESCLTCTRASTLLGFATDYHGGGHAHHRSRNDKTSGRKEGISSCFDIYSCYKCLYSEILSRNRSKTKLL